MKTTVTFAIYLKKSYTLLKENDSRIRNLLIIINIKHFLNMAPLAHRVLLFFDTLCASFL